MDSQFDVHDFLDRAQAVGRHRQCRCQRHARRRVGAVLLAAAALPATALAQTIPECKRSTFTKMVSAQQVEQAANQQYRQMLQQASSKQALGPKDHPQVVRLRAIAQRIIP
ncbi:MAG TPA: M48 family peptidase, partial [Burkholderiaceae bacterium]